jgi:cytochrome P450
MDTVLRGYDEVLAALRDPVLSGECGQFEEPVSLLVWPEQADDLARELFSRMPADRAVDLIAEFAQPWSRATAAAVTGAPVADLDRLEACAAQVFESNSGEATLELARVFAGEGVALKVQAFVALTQTLPALLGSAWLALLESPAEMLALGEDPALLPNAIEELLRFAGPSQIVYRGRIALMLAEANHDATRFPDPNRLDLGRRCGGHLAFGAGQHACVGAALIRRAMAVATPLFVNRFARGQIVGPREWWLTSPIRALRSLVVRADD